MQKVFILDGPDCTGKSTLANKLSDIYNISIYHLTYYDDREQFQKQFDIATDMIKKWAKGESEGFILDRYILSEYAYREAFRPEKSLIDNSAEMLDIIEHYSSLGVVDVIFTLPEDKIKWYDFFTKMCKQREEMYSGEKMLIVYEEYLKLWKKMRYNKHVYRFDLFENMKGDNKGKIFNILNNEN